MTLTALSLVSCLRSSFAKPLDLLKDGICGRGPDKRLAVRVVVRHVVLDRRLERLDTREGAAANALGRDLGKEALHLIQPARTRRREVHVVARVLGEPAGHLGHRRWTSMPGDESSR